MTAQNLSINLDYDEILDRFSDGYDAHERGDPRPIDKDEADGWDYRNDMVAGILVAAAERAEGRFDVVIGGEQ